MATAAAGPPRREVLREPAYIKQAVHLIEETVNQVEQLPTKEQVDRLIRTSNRNRTTCIAVCLLSALLTIGGAYVVATSNQGCDWGQEPQFIQVALAGGGTQLVRVCA